MTVFLIKYGMLAGFACLAAIIFGPIAFALWWLRAEHGTRLRTVVNSSATAAPGIAIFALWVALFDQIERVMRNSGFLWPWDTVAMFASFGVFNLCMNAWCRWGHPGT
jgi:hypothetical protein